MDGILKPVKSAENRLEQCRLDLNTRGIAENSQYLRTIDVKLDSLNEKVVATDERFETWKTENEERHRALIDENRQLVEMLMNSMYQTNQDKLRVEWLSQGSSTLPITYVAVSNCE